MSDNPDNPDDNKKPAPQGLDSLRVIVNLTVRNWGTIATLFAIFALLVTAYSWVRNQTTFYGDEDNDQYGVTSKSEAFLGYIIEERGKAPKGYSQYDTDCDDNNKKAFPGNTEYYSHSRADGTFDFNCDGKDEKKLKTIGKCSASGEKVSQEGWLLDTIPECGKTAKWVNDCDKEDNNKIKKEGINKAQLCR